MLRVAFAMAVAAVAYTAVSETTKAAPIAPLPAAVTNDMGNITPVYWYHGRYYRYRWHGHYYPYYYHHHYYHHRHWRHRHWYYY
jgi:hypothetical protein